MENPDPSVAKVCAFQFDPQVTFLDILLNRSSDPITEDVSLLRFIYIRNSIISFPTFVTLSTL